MKSFVCAICMRAFPEALAHEHHKIPKALGGTDDPKNLVTLCHSDHNNLHLIAYMLVNAKRTHEAEPTIASIFPDDIPARRRLLEFSAIVAKEMVLKKEIRKDARTELRTVVELPARYMELLRLTGYDNPRPNGKRKGVGIIIRELVAQDLCRRFPMLRDEILSLLPKSKATPGPDSD